MSTGDFLDEYRRVARLRHLSAATVKGYLSTIRRFIYFRGLAAMLAIVFSAGVMSGHAGAQQGRVAWKQYEANPFTFKLSQPRPDETAGASWRRTWTATGATTAGRDHNAKAMSIWFAGGGTKAGHVGGATDELGEKAVEVAHPIKDLHLTILHLLGLNDAQLSYLREGRWKRLSQAGGQVIGEIIA
jgi:hypothetical protein